MDSRAAMMLGIPAVRGCRLGDVMESGRPPLPSLPLAFLATFATYYALAFFLNVRLACLLVISDGFSTSWTRTMTAGAPGAGFAVQIRQP